jgi:hypothetical protein
MKRIRVFTEWTGTGTEADPNRPAIADAFPISSFSDMTGQPSANIRPSPNLFVAEIVCTEAVFAQIQASASYGDAILYDETI